MLAVRNFTPVHPVSDTMGSIGSAVQMQNTIAMRIQTVPPDQARNPKGYRIIGCRGVDRGVVAPAYGACRPSPRYS